VLFNSLIFLFIFLPITYGVFWGLRSAQSRYIWLAVTGYIFYGYWDPRFCLLMAFSTAVSYLAGLGFLYATTQRAKNWLLIVPITIDLCLLAFFKYANFALESIEGASALLGSRIDLPFYNIILPVGISFYTFHTITYIVDCFRGTIKPTKNVFEFSAYVSLFSQLVAGPIVRFRQIEDDLESLGSADRTRWLTKGIAFFLVGMLEKILLADTLAAWVDPAFKQAATLSTMGAWLAVLGYTFQLYFDFCGYSDMAVGLGYMFGIRIPQNFNSPYKALDPSDFWRRWHISLSTCLRDYLYIPLGGNRGGEWATNRNLLLTMLIGGLWHGANWTFVIWGLYHGLLLILHRATAGFWNKLPAVVRQVSMLLLVSVGWVYFRSENIESAHFILQRMFLPTSNLDWNEWYPFVPVLGSAMLWGMWGPNCFDLFNQYEWRVWHGPVFAILFGICVALIMGGGNSPFLYFQF
jgi:alginate O-acetyltransferase complex protein AlgI